MARCYLCKQELTKQNETIEHILLNSIGGRITSSKILCKDCNSKFGSSFDAELSKQLNFYANFLMITRERGNPPPVLMVNEKTGEKYYIDHEGVPIIEKPIVKQEKTANKVGISITARNMEEARSILNGLSKKYKNLNVDEALKQAVHVEKQITEPLSIKLTVGGKESMPAILKMAINYYVEKTGDIESISCAIEELKRNYTTRVEPIIFDKRLYALDDGEVSHSIFLLGSQSEKKLYAIVELFNAVSFIVKLSENYNKNDFEDLYVFDVLKCEEKKKTLIYKPSFDMIFTFEYPKSSPNFKIMEDATNRILQIAMERQMSFFNKSIDRKSMG
ncbi:MAG: HNH endonuclease [Treponematales bacterium]